MTTGTAHPTMHGALLWAAAGAGLFIGVGAMLPIWPAYTGLSFRHTQLPTAVEERLAWIRAGYPARTVFGGEYERFLMQPPLLLCCGAVAGLIGYFGCLGLRRKGGGV